MNRKNKIQTLLVPLLLVLSFSAPIYAEEPAEAEPVVETPTDDNAPLPILENTNSAVPEPIGQTAGRFSTAVGMGMAIDRQLVSSLDEVAALHKTLSEQTNTVQALQKQLQDLRNTPIPPPPIPPPFPNPNSSGGSPSAGGNGGGNSSGLEAPQMAQIPETSAFQTPEGPQEISPDLTGAANFGDGARSSSFSPGDSSLKGFTPQKLDLPKVKTPNTQGQFSPAQIAAQGMPKLKTLESAPPSGGASKTASNSPPSNNGGTGNSPMSGGGSGGMGTGGGDGASLNGVGLDGAYDSASGITVKDAGWGSSAGEGSSTSENNGTESSDSDKSSTKFTAGQVYTATPSAKGFIKRTQRDGSPDDTIFGKLSMWLDDSCDLAETKAGAKPEIKPYACEKAQANELQLASVEGTTPYKGAAKEALKEVPKDSSKPEIRKLLPKGLREIASEEQAVIDTEPKISPVAPSPSEDLLNAVRAQAL